MNGIPKGNRPFAIYTLPDYSNTEHLINVVDPYREEPGKLENIVEDLCKYALSISNTIIIVRL